MPASWCWKAAPSTASPSSSPAEGGTVSGGEGITVDVILPMEKAGSERVRRAAVARKLGISPSRIKDVRLVKESIDSRQKKFSSSFGCWSGWIARCRRNVFPPGIIRPSVPAPSWR